MQIYQIPGKLTGAWNNEVKAVVDTWANYSVTKEFCNNQITRLNTIMDYLNFAKDLNFL